MKFFNKLFILFFILMSNVFGQFGQNKVQYKNYDWFYIQTKHFDIYFSEQGKTIAEFTAHAAETAIDSIQNVLDYTINNRISLIVYNSHNDFQETNTTDEGFGQGTGGFTEPFKNRVVFPFEGSYQKFRHVIHHELVHAVIRDMLYGGTVQNIIAKGITLQLPSWYHEGMAEFLSSGWETNSDMFIRDAIINEYLPDIPGLGGYFAYRGGQSLFHYIAQTYGMPKIGELLHKIQATGGIEPGLKSSIGLNLEELNDRWKKSLKRDYWPGIKDRKDPDEFAKRMTNNKKDGGFYNTSPAISPQGDKIAFISDRDIYMNIYILDTYKGEVIDRVVESGRTVDFEELNVLYPSISWAPDNNRLAFSVKSSGYDVINILDVRNDESHLLPFKLDGIETVSWSPDNKRIAFVGANAKESDVYVWDFEKNELINLTKDIFSDYDPVFSWDGKQIFFSSDRGKYIDPKNELDTNFVMYDYNYQQLDLYSYNLETNKIERITNWEDSNEKLPVLSPDGSELIFVSDRNGIDNLYKKPLFFSDNDSAKSIVDLKAVPLTNSLNGINQISLSEDGKKLVFTSLFNGGYNIFMLNDPFEMKAVGDTLVPTNYMASVLYPAPEKTTADSSSTDSTNTNIVVETKVESDSSTTGNQTGGVIFTGQYVDPDYSKKDSTSGDYSDYIFGAQDNVKDSSEIVNRKELFKERLDTDGNFLVNKYKINFTPDLIYANAGYSTFYGLLGTTILSFSDMLGNHRLIGQTSLQVDLKNSDYGLAYYYLEKRINYGIEAFHTARFLYLSTASRTNLHRYRNFGGVFSASFPISRFHRLQGSLSFLRVNVENLDDPTIPIEKETYIIPNISLIHDNVLWGYTSPIEGTRYNLSAFVNPGVDDSRKSFYSITWDYRNYKRFWYDNGFLFRISGGYSGGAMPQKFMLGGTDAWINRRFANDEIPISNASDFAFLSPALPMRGYDYAQQLGSKYSLVNLELRMPLIRYLVTGPLPILFSNILGVAFLDAGSAWNNTEKLKFFKRDGNGNTITNDLLLGTGFGVRLYFLFLWKIDVAWSYNARSFSRPKYYISFGLDL